MNRPMGTMIRQAVVPVDTISIALKLLKCRRLVGFLPAEAMAFIINASSGKASTLPLKERRSYERGR